MTILDYPIAEGLDYLGGKFSLTLQPGDNTVCANVTIIDDDLIEDAEWFAATISSEETFVIIRNPSTTVKIAANDGKLKRGRRAKGEGRKVEGDGQGKEGERTHMLYAAYEFSNLFLYSEEFMHCIY